MPSTVRWPGGKAFAFTIFDDPDCQTVENGRPVYDFLAEHGFRTTKAIWPLAGTSPGTNPGQTCADEAYVAWVLDLQARGFEIGFHNATYHTSDRAATIRGLARFAELFGDYPRVMANHAGCREGMYWGQARLTGVQKTVYSFLKPKTRGKFQGHVETSPLFWGDICRQKIKYVRNFVFSDLNTLHMCPAMPYHDPLRPYVNYWFAASDGSDAASFAAALHERHQDRLAAQGGACIIYTHLGKGFTEGGRLHRRVRDLLVRLSCLGGWLVPVGTLLDHLLKLNGHRDLDEGERARLERRWLWEKLRRGTT